MIEVELNLCKNANSIANLKRAVEEARHYILMDVDTFAVRVEDIEIRRVNEN
jgi:NAD-dependent DNA ligase